MIVHTKKQKRSSRKKMLGRRRSRSKLTKGLRAQISRTAHMHRRLGA